MFGRLHHFCLPNHKPSTVGGWGTVPFYYHTLFSVTQNIILQDQIKHSMKSNQINLCECGKWINATPLHINQFVQFNKKKSILPPKISF